MSKAKGGARANAGRPQELPDALRTITLQIPLGLLQRLDAARHHISRAADIREAIEQYLERRPTGTTKVAINVMHTSDWETITDFRLSDAAVERCLELGMTCTTYDEAHHPLDYSADFRQSECGWPNSNYDMHHHYDNPQWRADPRLVQAIEELGDLANGPHANLLIVEVPNNIEWHIERRSNGGEFVAENYRRWGLNRD